MPDAPTQVFFILDWGGGHVVLHLWAEDTSYGGLEESRCCCSARFEFTEDCPIRVTPLVSAVVVGGTDFSDFDPGANIMSSLISHALEIVTHGQELIICARELITSVPK